MSSFFTTPSSQKKRKRQDTASKPAAAKKRNAGNSARAPPSRSQQIRDDESISGSSGSSDEDDGQDRAGTPSDDESSAEDETAADRRLKLAERYLDNVRANVAEEIGVDGFDAADVDRELISRRLKEDVAEDKGKIYRHIAVELDTEHATKSFFRVDCKTVTGVAICLPHAYTVSKDMTLVKWGLVNPEHANGGAYPRGWQAPRRKKPKMLLYTKARQGANKKPISQQKHTAAILCVAASADGKFVVTGGADKKIIVWDAVSLKPLKVFTQHRDAVTSLAFRGKTNQLFSASKDRTIKMWSLNELANVDTLFGHQDEVVDVAACGGSEERCVSVGARDRSARLWKIVEENQLVFRGGGTGSSSRNKISDAVPHTNGDHLEAPNFTEGSLDRVIQLDTQLFVTGSDSGSLSLYSLHKKKPMFVLPLAHGYDPPVPVEESLAEVEIQRQTPVAGPTPRWITALACVPFTDLFISGSWDGQIRLWRLSEDHKSIEAAGVLGSEHAADEVNGMSTKVKTGAIRGVVNDLSISERGDRGRGGVCIVAAISAEQRLGRWRCGEGKVKDGALVFEIPRMSMKSQTLPVNGTTNVK